ncbi:MAG: hypothetical protein LUO93_01485 [Methanomicrobiales archaeon]|nr:hypothetical protein [Methanomicrobiales archaeon]
MSFPYRYWWASGIILIALGMIQGLISGGKDDVATMGLITSGIFIIIVLLGKEIREEKGPRQDERTKRIGAWGLSYSWSLTFVTLFVLFWAQYLGVLILSGQIMILLLVLEMAVSARAFQWYFFRKGDVE